MPMSPERRAEIRAAVEHIHPGPWFAVPLNDTPDMPTKDMPCIPHPHWDLCYGDRENPSNVACILTDYDETGVKGKEDIEFIAGARQWIPELLDEADDLRDGITLKDAAIERSAREWLDKYNADMTALVAQIEKRVDAAFLAGAEQVAEQLDAVIAENTKLTAQLQEWEQYTGFLYSHGFFRDPKTNPAVVAQATYEATRCPRCHELQCICATLTTTEDPPHV